MPAVAAADPDAKTITVSVLTRKNSKYIVRTNVALAAYNDIHHEDNIVIIRRRRRRIRSSSVLFRFRTQCFERVARAAGTEFVQTEKTSGVKVRYVFGGEK